MCVFEGGGISRKYGVSDPIRKKFCLRHRNLPNSMMMYTHTILLHYHTLSNACTWVIPVRVSISEMHCWDNRNLHNGIMHNDMSTITVVHFSDRNQTWKWAQEVWVRSISQYKLRKYVDIREDWMLAEQRCLALFAIVKLRILQTSVMGSQKSYK